MKYIIKNCPCYCEGIVVKGNQKLTKACESIRRTIKEGEYKLENCCNINDCIIKQIVGLCKENKFFSYGAVMLGNGLSADILDLLEIEEVNE